MAPGEGWASIGSQLFYIEMYIKKIFSKIIGPEKLKLVCKILNLTPGYGGATIGNKNENI